MTMISSLTITGLLCLTVISHLNYHIFKTKPNAEITDLSSNSCYNVEDKL